MYIGNMTSGCTHLDAHPLFVSLDDLDNISFLSDEDNDLEDEITLLFNKAGIFMYKTCTVIRVNFERFQVCFLV